MLKTVSETRGGIMFTSAQRKRWQNMVALVKHFQELETPPAPDSVFYNEGLILHIHRVTKVH